MMWGPHDFLIEYLQQGPGGFLFQIIFSSPFQQTLLCPPVPLTGSQPRAMKFGKEYQSYMHGMEQELPALGLKRLKEMIKKCQAVPCPPQLHGGCDDDAAATSAVVVTGGSGQCSGAGRHCYGNYLVLAPQIPISICFFIHLSRYTTPSLVLFFFSSHLP
jgi:hypothetical protein